MGRITRCNSGKIKPSPGFILKAKGKSSGKQTPKPHTPEVQWLSQSLNQKPCQDLFLSYVNQDGDKNKNTTEIPMNLAQN